ncbi:phosphate regulon sensor protein PhoR [Arenicella chitinivorans]|uniref:Phosphate regulon sensor protein PhoR n=1 Tax=Arenicella chitinivorans TaxID=1329800 RepID=A0A918S0N3_9GAMM|nr:phosphate regulon sensor histidine kinase PhoR [Arenicella chitinivorans]GHA15972.1 phosphate regulon sensor protein PhoR [Arenicella chitinivorans]
MRQDIWKFTLLLIIAGIVGLALGAPLVTLLVMALGIIGMQISGLRSLRKWVENPGGNPMPETSGQLYQLHRDLSRKDAQYTKRKRRLNEFVSQFRSAIGALPDAIVLIDNEGKIEWANGNAEHLLGIRWPADAGLRFVNLIRNADVAKMLRPSEPPTEGVEVTGTVHSQIINLKCVRYTNQQRMVIARDVSRLIQVNKMHADFVANVSHELKTPLTVLRGYLEIIENSADLPQKYLKPLTQMRTQSARMQSIVSDLLYLARLEDHNHRGTFQTVDVTHVINAIMEAVQPLIAEKNHKIELDVDYSLSILGIQTELYSAFNNLITNAIHYTPKDGLIRVRWCASTDGASFSVIDNGIGIAPQHIERLTQRFYRVDTDRSRDSGGTGLGLAIVKHVLQRHNGELIIESNEDVGSEFRCYFPTEQLVVVKRTQSDADSESA